MKKAILTGANGFVGFALLKDLICNDYEVYCIVRPESQEIFNNKCANLYHRNNIVVISSDIDDVENIYFECRKEKHFDVFFHFAWDGSAGIKRSDITIQQRNVMMSRNMVELAVRLNCKRFVGAGSIMEDEVLDMVYEHNINSTINYIYSAAKLQAHLISSIIAKNSGIEFIWGKITNIYGVGDRTNRFVNNTLKKMLNNEECKFSKGDQIYDFVYIDDAANAFRLLGEKGIDGKMYTIGSGEATSLRTFIEKMAMISNTNSPLSFGSVGSGICYLSSDKYDIISLKKDVGFCPIYGFDEGIRRTIEFIKLD